MKTQAGARGPAPHAIESLRYGKSPAKIPEYMTRTGKCSIFCPDEPGAGRTERRLPSRDPKGVF